MGEFGLVVVVALWYIFGIVRVVFRVVVGDLCLYLVFPCGRVVCGLLVACRGHLHLHA